MGCRANYQKVGVSKSISQVVYKFLRNIGTTYTQSNNNNVQEWRLEEFRTYSLEHIVETIEIHGKL